MLQHANRDPECLKTAVNGDKIWAYGYDPETNVQSLEWKTQGPQRPKKHDKYRVR